MNDKHDKPPANQKHEIVDFKKSYQQIINFIQGFNIFSVCIIDSYSFSKLNFNKCNQYQ